LDDFAWSDEQQKIWANIAKKGYHEFANPLVICVLFSKATFVRGKSSDSDNCEPTISGESFLEYLACGADEMPKRFFWRPRKSGRDRDTFEPDTDAESDADEDQESRSPEASWGAEEFDQQAEQPDFFPRLAL
jgi:hypothetical protein